MRGLLGKIEKEKVQYEEKKKFMVRVSIINLIVLVINVCCNCLYRINIGQYILFGIKVIFYFC